METKPAPEKPLVARVEQIREKARAAGKIPPEPLPAVPRLPGRWEERPDLN